MLIASAAFSELNRRHQVFLDGVPSSPIDLPFVLDTYRGLIRQPSSRTWEVDVDEQVAQSMFASDQERTLDRVALQLATYCKVLTLGVDPTWTAITGYYAAFFAANALLLGSGEVTYSLAPVGPVPSGMYRVVGTYIGGYPPKITIKLASLGGGSHRATWSSLARLVAEIARLGGLDSRSQTILLTLQALVSKPTQLSDFRNTINYSLDQGAFARLRWQSEVVDVADAESLEERLLQVSAVRDEVRVELVCLCCSSLLAALYSAYSKRTVRVDKRLALRRRQNLTAGQMPEFAANLGAWLF